MGLPVGTDQGVNLGLDGEERGDAVFALASGGTLLISSSTHVNGTAIAVDPVILFDPISNERAGWGWSEPEAARRRSSPCRGSDAASPIDAKISFEW